MLTPAATIGKSSYSAVERVYKQTVALTDLAAQDGGHAAFVNVHKILRDAD